MKDLKTFILIAALATSFSAYSQCRSFVKNNCGDAMAGYIAGENFNGAKFQPGDEAELQMTFYSDNEYRLLICSHPVLGDVEFSVLDDAQTLLFSNKNNDMTDHFDFRVGGTQELTIQIKVPEKNGDGITPLGCIGIITGRKSTGNDNSNTQLAN